MPPTHVLLLLLLVAFALIVLLRSVLRVTLYDDRIEVATWYRTTVVRRDAIAGYRIVPSKVPVYSFAFKTGRELDDGSFTLNVSRNIKTDPAWDAWLADIPDLNAEARAEALAEIQGNVELGATPEARVGHWKRAVWASWGLWILTLILSLLLPLGHQIADVAIVGLIAMPWLALALVTMRMRTFSRPGFLNGGPIPILLFLIPVPGVPLAFIMATYDFHSVAPALTILATGGALVLLTSVSVMCVRGNISYIAAAACAVFLLSGLYCYEAIAMTNYRLDSGRAALFSTTIKEKLRRPYVDKQGKVHVNYEMTLNPWGPEREEAHEVVSAWQFEHYAPGDTVCIELFRGALGIPWYRVVVPDRKNTPCE